jgi:hypothetical protein
MTDRELLQQALDAMNNVKDMAWDSDSVAGRKLIEAIRTRLAQPEKEWVGLTMEERDEINNKVYGWVPHYVAFHHAIEQALKEKNAT